MGRDEQRDLAAASVSALLAAAIYLATLAPTVTGEDSGELVTAAWTLGIAHAPGFPLYCLLGFAFSHVLALGEVAWRLNLFSALCAAAAVGFAFLASRRLGAQRAAAMTGALLLAVSQRFWASAVVAEVYTLDAALLAALLWRLFCWRATRTTRDLAIAAAVYGFALTNHLPLALLAGPPVVAWVLWLGGRGIWTPSRISAVALAAAPPLGLYAYLPWAASRDSALRLGDPSHWSGFWDHVTRANFRAIERAEPGGLGDALVFAADFLAQFGSQWTPWLTVPLLLAALAALLARREAAVLLLGVIVFNSLVMIGVRRPTVDAETLMLLRAYYLPATVAGAVAVACGLEWLGETVAARSGATAARGVRLALLALPVAGLAVGWSDRDLGGYTLYRDVNLATLESFESNAVYVPGPDYRSFPAVYLQAVLGIRPDVLLVDIGGRPEAAALAYARSLGSRSDPRSTAELVPALIAGPRPVYLTRRADVANPDRFEFRSTGLAYRVTERGALPPRSVPGPPPGGEARSAKLASTPARDAVERLLRSELHRLNAERQLDAGDRSGALESFGRSIDAAWEAPAGLNNLAGILAGRGFFEQAERCVRRAIELQPDYALARQNFERLLRRPGRRESGPAGN